MENIKLKEENDLGDIEELESRIKALEKENEEQKDQIEELNDTIEKMSDAAYDIYQMKD